MPIKNIAEYIFPLILIIAATLLSLNEKRNVSVNSEQQNRVRNIRRKIGIFMMYITAILIAVGIYKLQHNNFDFFMWGFASANLIGIMVIGTWDIISELGKLRKNIAKECETDYNNLIEELKKAEIREKTKKKSKKKKDRDTKNIDTEEK